MRTQDFDRFSTDGCGGFVSPMLSEPHNEFVRLYRLEYSEAIQCVLFFETAGLSVGSFHAFAELDGFGNQQCRRACHPYPEAAIVAGFECRNSSNLVVNQRRFHTSSDTSRHFLVRRDTRGTS